MRAALVIAAAVAVAAPAYADEAADKAEAQALVTEGVKLLKSKSYDEALAKFQAAYAKFPSPKILLNLGATLRDMGRLADAANTYDRYLTDPDSGADRIVEVKKILADLDKELVLLTLEVTPAGAFVSIDGGEWIVAASSQVSRVMPGSHLVRARKAGFDDTEETVEGSPGERRTVSITLKVAEARDTSTGTGTGTGTVTGNDAGTGDKVSGNRHVGHTGVDVAIEDEGGPVFEPIEGPAQARRKLPDLGVQARIDGKLRGAAAAIALSYAPIATLEIEGAALISKQFGAYLGARYRILDTRLRPIVSAGVPVFFSDGARWGARIAGGGEWELSPHVRLLAELGFEHFFNPEVRMVDGVEITVEANVFVPILGIAGRL